MSALNPTHAEKYFDDLELKLRLMAETLRSFKMAELWQAAHINEHTAVVAGLAGYIAGRKDLMEILRQGLFVVLADDRVENGPWVLASRTYLTLIENRVGLNLPASVKGDDVRPAVDWLVRYLVWKDPDYQPLEDKGKWTG
jgi:hypothetical protein